MSRSTRSSTRKTRQPIPSGSINSSSKAIDKKLEPIDQLFNLYANKSSMMIEPEGIEALCLDMEVDHTDVRILMLAWKMQAEKQGYFTREEMQAEKQGYFTREEWRRGFKSLSSNNIRELKKSLPGLEKEVLSPPSFVDFYSYAFRYCLTEEKQKCIDIESICELLKLVLASQFCQQVDSFIDYLNSQSDYKVINMDQWLGFFRFCSEISFPDLNNYDSVFAWPSILDDFVEWMKEKQS